MYGALTVLRISVILLSDQSRYSHPKKSTPIPMSHPVWALPNMDPTPPPRNMHPTNTNPPIPQFDRSIDHSHPFSKIYAISYLNFLA